MPTPTSVDEDTSPEELSGALLEAMRLGDLKLLKGFRESVRDKRLFEESLTAAWCKAKALCLPISKHELESVVETIVQLRYELSRDSDGGPPVTEGKPLWDQVDQLVADAERLQHLLAAPAEEADEAVMLAMRSALAIRAVKYKLLRTYGTVPWEEMEYLLVLYVEANTVYRTLAFLVASPERIRAHLDFFLEKVKQIDRVESLEELRKEPKGERVDWVKTITADGIQESGPGRLAEMIEDFTLLRDWHSLGDILESLKAATEALGLDDNEWEQWGWLALRGGLFVAGEKMKNSWKSPNLSSRFAMYLELMAPERITKLLRNGIRDVQAHSKEGTNADALTLSAFSTTKERDCLSEDMNKVVHAAEYMIREIEADVVKKRVHQRASSEQYQRVILSIRVSESPDEVPIHGEVIEILERILLGSFRHSSALALILLIDDLQADLSGSGLANIEDLLFSETVRHSLNEKNGKTLLSDLLLEARERIFIVVQELSPFHFARIRKLLTWKGAEGLSSLQADLNRMSRCPPGNEDSRALSALKSIPLNRWNSGSSNLHRYAIEGGLRVLASRQHSATGRQPTAAPPQEPHAPTLHGRVLRNYLNHGDLAVRLFTPAEMEIKALYSLIKIDVGDPLGGSYPSLRDSQISADEQLRLSALKDEMFRAARRGELAGVQRAAEAGVDISSRDCRGRTLLHAAADAGQPHVVHWLLEAEAVDPLARDWKENSALHCAANAKVAKPLLDAAGFVVNTPNTFGSIIREDFEPTALHSTAWLGRTDALRPLLSHERVNDGWWVLHMTKNPLSLAALGGHVDTMRLLIADGWYDNPLGNEGPGIMGPQTPLYHAACGGSADAVRLLLQESPSDTDCWVAADQAGYLGHVDAARVLIDELHRRGASIDCEAGHDAVHSVAKGGSVEVASALLDRWPEAVSLEVSIQGGAMLHTAAMRGHVDLVKLLLDRGADLLQRDMKSQTALHGAASGGFVKIIDVFLEHTKRSTASRELQSLWIGSGELTPPLCMAATYGQLEAAQRLVALGADMNTGRLNRTHETPLYAAAREGHASVVEWLLGKGVRLHGEEAADTPLHAAADFGQLAVVQRLLPEPNRTAEEERPRSLALLQHVGEHGCTALHRAAASGSLAVVKLLLEREVQLLAEHYDEKLRAGREPLKWRDFTVYRRDTKPGSCHTPLQRCVLWGAPSAVFRALLGHMEDDRVMALGGEDVQTVRGMVQKALDMIDADARGRLWLGLGGESPDRELNESLARLQRREALQYLLQSIGPEDMTDQPITLPSKAPQDSEDSIAPVFLIPGIEGMAVTLQSLCEYIKAPTLVLQLPYTDEKNRTIQDFTQSVYKHIKSRLAPKASFKLVGYSFGGMVSTELVRLLEQDGHVGELVLLDGAPAGMQELTKVWIKEDGNTTELEMDVLVRLWFLTNQSDFDNFRCTLETQDRLSKESSLVRRLRQIIPKKIKTAAHSEKGMAAAFRSFVNRIVAVNNYRPPSSAKKLRSTVTLIRPTNQTFNHDREDYSLTDLFAQETIPVHFVEGDHNTMLDNVETAAIINSVLVEGTAGNKMFGDKVPADFRLSAKSQ